jgi:hypothetical protein
VKIFVVTMVAHAKLFFILMYQCSLGLAFTVSYGANSIGSGCLPNLRMKGGDDAQTLTLNDGTKHPIIGFGTYKVGFIPASASSASVSPSTSTTPGPSARECVR